MLFGFFLTLGVPLLSAGLRSFQNSYTQKAGALGILAATFLGVYLSPTAGYGFCRRNELALSAVAGNSHSDSGPSASQGKTASTEKPAVFDTFPALSEITREIEDEGFVHVGDAGWIGKIIGNFPAFYREEDRAQAAYLPERTAYFSFIICAFHRAPRGTV